MAITVKKVMKKYASNIFKISNHKGYYAMRNTSFHKLSASQLKQIRKKGRSGHYA